MEFVLRSCFAAALLVATSGNSQAQTTPTPTPRMLVEVADLSGLAISPDGSSAAFRVERASIERNTYDSTWYVTDIKGEQPPLRIADGSEEHTSELQSLMRISYAVFCLKKKQRKQQETNKARKTSTTTLR